MTNKEEPDQDNSRPAFGADPTKVLRTDRLATGVDLTKRNFAHDYVAKIESFQLTSDSVVAFATVVTSGAVRRIVITWGDATEETHTSFFGDFELTTLPPNVVPLPKGTYRYAHAFDPPDGGETFEREVNIRVEQANGEVEERTNVVRLTPRYAVHHFITYIALQSNCDGPHDLQNEFTIKYYIDNEKVAEDEWDVHSGFLILEPHVPLHGTALHRELEKGDPKVKSRLEFRERDWIWDDRSNAQTTLRLADSDMAQLNLNNRDLFETIRYKTAGDCDIALKYKRKVKLLVPIPNEYGAWVFSA